MKIQKALKRTTYSLAAVATAATVCGTVTAASAAPSDVHPMGCGATAATVYGNSGPIYSASCDGDYYYTRQWTTKLVANGWSGAVYSNSGGGPWYFCDWQTITINAYTNEIFLNNTKPARCK